MKILISINIMAFMAIIIFASKLKELKDFFKQLFENLRYLNTMFLIILFILLRFNIPEYDFLIALFTEMQIIFIIYYLIYIVDDKWEVLKTSSFLVFVTLMLAYIKHTSLGESIGLKDVVCFYGVVTIYYFMVHSFKIFYLVIKRMFKKSESNSDSNISSVTKEEVELNDIGGFAGAFNFKLGYPPKNITLEDYKLRIKSVSINIGISLIIIICAIICTFYIYNNYQSYVKLSRFYWISTSIALVMLISVIILTYFQELKKGNNIISNLSMNFSKKTLVENKKFIKITILECIIIIFAIIIVLSCKRSVYTTRIIILLIIIIGILQLLRVKFFN